MVLHKIAFLCKLNIPGTFTSETYIHQQTKNSNIFLVY